MWFTYFSVSRFAYTVKDSFVCFLDRARPGEIHALVRTSIDARTGKTFDQRLQEAVARKAPHLGAGSTGRRKTVLPVALDVFTLRHSVNI